MEQAIRLCQNTQTMPTISLATLHPITSKCFAFLVINNIWNVPIEKPEAVSTCYRKKTTVDNTDTFFLLAIVVAAAAVVVVR